jgi:hypothetical protein
MGLEAVAAFPARRSTPESPPTWSDSRRLVWGAVKELRNRHPKVDERRVGQLLAERIENDDDLREASAHLLAHDALAGERVHRQQHTSSPGQRAERQAVERVAVQKAAAKVKQIAILDMTVTLLSGAQKALRFCLGSEVAELGAAYSRIAERVGADNLVGEILTSGEAAELMRATPA